MLRDQRFHARPFSVSLSYINANQNHSQGWFLQTVNEFTEILVFRQQNATFRKGNLQDFIVGDAGPSFRHINDVVTGSPKAGYNARVAALIGKKFHGFTRYPKAICSSAR